MFKKLKQAFTEADEDTNREIPKDDDWENLTPGERHDLWQRDKEIRAEILNTLFGRLVWINAGALVLLLTGVAKYRGLRENEWLVFFALLSYLLALTFSLILLPVRFEASFYRSTRSILSAQLIAAAIFLTAVGTGLVILAILV